MVISFLFGSKLVRRVLGTGSIKAPPVSMNRPADAEWAADRARTSCSRPHRHHRNFRVVARHLSVPPPGPASATRKLNIMPASVCSAM